MLSAEEIKTLQPADGFMVFNTTTGCLNYWFKNNWFELCGSCTPKASPPAIDSIRQIKNKLKIWGTFTASDSITIIHQNKQYHYTELPITISVYSDSTNLGLTFRTYNSCGYRDTVVYVKWNPVNISDIKQITVEDYTFNARKYGDTWWMCENSNILNENKSSKIPDGFISYTESKNVCPVGWSVPEINDWQNLFSYFDENTASLFQKADSKNKSPGLEKKGAYHKTQIISEGSSGYYWTKDKQNGKQGIFIVSDNGHLSVYETAKDLYIPVRCVKHE